MGFVNGTIKVGYGKCPDCGKLGVHSTKGGFECRYCVAEERNTSYYNSIPIDTLNSIDANIDNTNKFDIEGLGILSIFAIIVIGIIYLLLIWSIEITAGIAVILLVGGSVSIILSRFVFKNNFPEFNRQKDILENIRTFGALIISSSFLGILVLSIIYEIILLIVSSIIANIILIILVGISLYLINRKYKFINKLKNKMMPTGV